MPHPTVHAPPRARWLWPAAASLATALVLVTVSPLFPRLGAATGDAALGQEILDALGSRGRHHLAIARISPGDPAPRFAGFGADETTEFEIGSVTKTFTGILLAQAIEAGEVKPETTLGDVFGARAGRAALVTLQQLTTHTSGLPRLEPGSTLTSLKSAVLHTDPYTKTEAQLLAGLATIDTPTPVDPQSGEAEYSNYSVALLGLALAQAAQTDYATLLRERILDPLGMDDTYLPVTRDGLADDAPHGYAAGGVPASAWTMHASAAAGGIRSTAADMARYVQAVMTGELPGSKRATTRQALMDPGRGIGCGWMMRLPESGKQAMTFHNGGTGGYSSIVGFTPDGTGLIVLADTTRSVDAALTALPTAKERS